MAGRRVTWQCQWQEHCVHHQRRMPLQQILGGGQSPSKKKSHLSEHLFKNYLHETLCVIEIKQNHPTSQVLTLQGPAGPCGFGNDACEPGLSRAGSDSPQGLWRCPSGPSGCHRLKGALVFSGPEARETSTSPLSWPIYQEKHHTKTANSVPTLSNF